MVNHPSRSAVAAAAREELIEAGPDAVLSTLRLGVRLKPGDIAQLKAALRDLGDQYSKRDDPVGAPVGILAVVHRRKE